MHGVTMKIKIDTKYFALHIWQFYWYIIWARNITVGTVVCTVHTTNTHRGISETRNVYGYYRAKHKCFLIQEIQNLILHYFELPYGT